MATNGVVVPEQQPVSDVGTTAPNWVPVLEQPAWTAIRKLRVICIGAGYSGLILAHKIQHELKLEDEIDLTIYDRNAGIGGVWFENTYPGAACDIPSHAYVFPFEGNPDWSKFYVDQKEILAYIKGTAEKYNLTKYVQLNSKIVETIWDEDSTKWKVKVEQNGQVKEDEADILINASGFLNKWKWPDIPGRDVYKGKMVHSARWDNSFDWEGKKVAVIGNGASGIQLVTNMQPKVSSLVNYMRNPTWISTNFLDDKTPEGKNFAYSEEQRKEWRETPEKFYAYRRDLELAVNMFYYAMRLDSPIQPLYEGACKARMQKSLKDAPELEKRITPTFKAGCRRITPGDGYLEALQQPNCKDCWDDIECFTENGIKTSNGEEEFDMIVCATGFDGSWHPQWKHVGRNGVNVEDMWKDHPEAFLASSVPNMPNYFMINGPNIPISHGSVLQQMDWVAHYALKWIKKMNREDIKTLEVKPEAVADYNVYNQELLKRTTFSGDCRAFYKNGRRVGHINALYGGSMMHFKNALELAGGEHYNMTWRSKNRFRWLGDGTAESDKNGMGDLAPYF